MACRPSRCSRSTTARSFSKRSMSYTGTSTDVSTGVVSCHCHAVPCAGDHHVVRLPAAGGTAKVRSGLTTAGSCDGCDRPGVAYDEDEGDAAGVADADGEDPDPQATSRPAATMHRGNRRARERIAEGLCQTRRVATATSSAQCKRTRQPRRIRFGTFHKVCARLLWYL